MSSFDNPPNPTPKGETGDPAHQSVLNRWSEDRVLLIANDIEGTEPEVAEALRGLGTDVPSILAEIIGETLAEGITDPEEQDSFIEATLKTRFMPPPMAN